MDVLRNGDIVPGESIGVFNLGWTLEELKNVMGNKYVVEKRANSDVIKTDTIWFWINEKNLVFQITVFKGFDGQFKSKIGIGNTISDIEKYFEKCNYELYVYILPSIAGICFELEDVEDIEKEWDETTAAISSISVFVQEELGLR